MNELKQCPFCWSEKIGATASFYGVKVYCVDCGAEVESWRGEKYKTVAVAERMNRAKAVKKWNTRVTP